MTTEKILRLIEESRQEMDERNELNNRGGQYDYTEGYIDGAKMILHRIENTIVKGEEYNMVGSKGFWSDEMIDYKATKELNKLSLDGDEEVLRPSCEAYSKGFCGVDGRRCNMCADA